MKRLSVELSELVAWDNLLAALWKAAKGKRHRPDVRCFLENHEQALIRLQACLLKVQLPDEAYRRFRIRDPKPREIVAVGFSSRVMHHAIMNLIGRSLEKSQIHHSYACLPGRGVHAAVRQVQRGMRRGKWFVQIDIEHYFANIDHGLLRAKLARRFKGPAFLQLLDNIIDSYQTQPGKGLPIGSLTSQYFANFFLEACDRFIQQLAGSKGYLRYMDDMVWFCDNRADALSTLQAVEAFLQREKLKIKPNRQIQPTGNGIGFCGFGVHRHRIALSQRKKQAYVRHLARWQADWQAGEINSLQLQRGYDAVHAVTHPADALGFRRSVLERVTKVEA